MCPTERYTLNRGRSGVPDTLVRTRACTRWRCSSRDNLRTGTDATVVSLAVLSYKFSVFSTALRAYELKTRNFLPSVWPAFAGGPRNPSSPTTCNRKTLFHCQTLVLSSSSHFLTANLRLKTSCPLPDPLSEISSQNLFTDNLRLKTQNSLGRPSLGARLARLLLQTLAGDADVLLLVRVWRTQRANVRGHLADLRLVRAAHHDVRLLFDRNLNAIGNGKLDGVGLAEGESHGLAFQLGAIADAHDVEILLEALGDAMNGVGQKRARQPVQCAILFIIADRRQHAVLLLEPDLPRHKHEEFPLGALHFHLAAAGVDFYAGRHWNRFATNT